MRKKGLPKPLLSSHHTTLNVAPAVWECPHTSPLVAPSLPSPTHTPPLFRPVAAAHARSPWQEVSHTFVGAPHLPRANQCLLAWCCVCAQVTLAPPQSPPPASLALPHPDTYSSPECVVVVCCGNPIHPCVSQPPSPCNKCFYSLLFTWIATSFPPPSPLSVLLTFSCSGRVVFSSRPGRVCACLSSACVYVCVVAPRHVWWPGVML